MKFDMGILTNWLMHATQKNIDVRLHDRQSVCTYNNDSKYLMRVYNSVQMVPNLFLDLKLQVHKPVHM